jgi:hypothetical protein
LCLGVAFLLDRDGLYVRYRCLTQAVTLSSCFEDKPIDFVADIVDGVRYEGNTSNEIDRFIFFLGAYEKPILYFFRDAMASAYANQGIFLDGFRDDNRYE